MRIIFLSYHVVVKFFSDVKFDSFLHLPHKQSRPLTIFHMYHHMNNFSHISLQSFQNIASDFPLPIVSKQAMFQSKHKSTKHTPSCIATKCTELQNSKLTRQFRALPMQMQMQAQFDLCLVFIPPAIPPLSYRYTPRPQKPAMCACLCHLCSVQCSPI